MADSLWQSQMSGKTISLPVTMTIGILAAGI
jgi:hypothetical protein